MGKRKRICYYAVVYGRKPGIYSTWDECNKQVYGFSNAKYASFDTIEEANNYIKVISDNPSYNPNKKQKIKDIIQNTKQNQRINSKINIKPQQITQSPSSNNIIDLTDDSDIYNITLPLKKQSETLLYFEDKKGIIKNNLKPEFIPTTNTSPLKLPRKLPLVNINHLKAYKTSKKQITKDSKQSLKEIKKQSQEKEDFTPIIPHDNEYSLESLGEDQKKVFHLVVDKGESVFFTGSAGTGKSYLLNVITKALDKKYKSSGLYITASTGIAAIQIGGQTLHSFAGIELGTLPFEQLVTKAKKKKTWKKCRTLIIDEISMISGKLFDQLEEIARIVLNNIQPFGGIQLIVCGDFFQLPPVKRSEKFAFQAKSWSKCIPKTIELTHVYRQKNDEFIQCLNSIRHGVCSIKNYQFLQQAQRSLSIIDGVLPTRLYCTNKSVDYENLKELSLIKKDEITLHAYDASPNNIPPKHRTIVLPIIKQSQERCLATKEITLKEGAQVMLLRNYTEKNLVNGSRGVVIGFESVTKDNYEQKCDEWCSITTSSFEEAQIKTWIKFQFDRDNVYNDLPKDSNNNSIVNLPVVKFATGIILRPVFPCIFGVVCEAIEYVYRIQIPLKLSWAITVHKSQGMTLDRCQLNLQQVFNPGQAYVALSRVNSLEGLELQGFTQKIVFADNQVLKFYAEKCNDPVSKKILELKQINK